MRIGVTVFMCGCVMAAASPGEARSLHHWDQASSVTAGAIAALAFGVPLIRSDEAGMAQAGLSMVAGTGTAFALKSLVHERRPDGSDRHSFPSGHASFSFAAAASLENRFCPQRMIRPEETDQAIHAFAPFAAHSAISRSAFTAISTSADVLNHPKLNRTAPSGNVPSVR